MEVTYLVTEEDPLYLEISKSLAIIEYGLGSVDGYRIWKETYGPGINFSTNFSDNKIKCGYTLTFNSDSEKLVFLLSWKCPEYD